MLRVAALAVSVAAIAQSQQTALSANANPADLNQTIQALIGRLSAAEARIRDLEQHQMPGPATPAMIPATAIASAPQSSAFASSLLPSSSSITAPPNTSTVEPVVAPAPEEDAHAHMMQIPGGPELKIRGFFDFNYGTGPAANPLQFPLGGQAHSTFQAGEFDLYVSSKISEHLDFVGEMIFGWDSTNNLGVDVERYQLTWKQNEYFQIGGGRYHSAIGYYNTAYHHGTWFGTAEGRPFMYYYEDSGGLLPVHNVGLTASGLVPGTGALHLHWIAEVGNGRSSSNAGQPVQNFLSDRNHKSYNLAFYARPEWARGLQVGGSYYRDRLVPDAIPHITQTVTSAYAVFIGPRWEFLNEAVLLTNTMDGAPKAFRTPLMYTQVSRAFGKYRPFFRYQYVNSPAKDPINVYTDRYQGPSVGVRWDFSDFAAFKLQYNRVDQRSASSNSLNAQVGLTF